MVVISNSERAEAVRYLQRLSELVKDDDRVKVVDLRRRAVRLAGRLERKALFSHKREK